MSTGRRIAATTRTTKGGRDGQRGTLRVRDRSDRADDLASGVGDPHELVAGRGAEAARAALRLHAAGCGTRERADCFRRLADEIRLIAGRLERRARAGALCQRHLALNDADALSIDERIVAGDRSAVIDAGVEDATEILEVCHRMSEALTDSDVLVRLAEVRTRQIRTGRQWHGEAVSGLFAQETLATDRVGKEPRGPRRRQERTRQAKAGEPATKRRKRC